VPWRSMLPLYYPGRPFKPMAFQASMPSGCYVSTCPRWLLIRIDMVLLNHGGVESRA